MCEFSGTKDELEIFVNTAQSYVHVFLILKNETIQKASITFGVATIYNLVL